MGSSWSAKGYWAGLLPGLPRHPRLRCDLRPPWCRPARDYRGPVQPAVRPRETPAAVDPGGESCGPLIEIGRITQCAIFAVVSGELVRVERGRTNVTPFVDRVEVQIERGPAI